MSRISGRGFIVRPETMLTNRDNDLALIDEFVASFPKLDELVTCYESDPIAWELAMGDGDEFGLKQWRPVKQPTERNFLEEIYARLPARFPPLYELLILNYRWAEVDLVEFRLLANPLGQNLTGLLHEIQQAEAMWSALAPAGYLQFGKGPELNYDAICFDLRRRQQDGDYRIVQIDHEEILCNFRIKEVAPLADSFRELVSSVISKARAIDRKETSP